MNPVTGFQKNSEIDLHQLLNPSAEGINDLQVPRKAPEQENYPWIFENNISDSIFDDPGKAKGIKSEYQNAQDSAKINRAKEFLHQNNFNLKLLLQQPDFAGYNKTFDFKQFVRKYVNNNKTRQVKHSSKSKSLISEPLEVTATYEQVKESDFTTNVSFASDQKQNKEPLPQIFINYGSIIGHEILIKHLESFKNSKYYERSCILQDIVTRNTQSLFSFLNNFENANEEQMHYNLFSLLVDLIQSNNNIDQDSKPRIFLAALGYYMGERITVEDELIQESILLLVRSPNTRQALGLANYVFFNNVAAFTKQLAQVQKLDSTHPNILQLMGQTWSVFEVDSQVKKLIPFSFFILNVPFITLLRQDGGLHLIRDIPVEYTEYFVRICALICSPTVDLLKEYIQITRATFLQKQEVIDSNTMVYFMKGLAQRLQSRDVQWVGKISQIQKLQQQIIEAQIEKNVILNNNIIENCLNGDSSEIQRILHLPRNMEAFSDKTIVDLLQLFENANIFHQLAIDFNKKPQNERLSVSADLEKLQQNLGFKLYSSQILCINYICENLQANHLIHFGIGNGKTLICFALAILIALKSKLSVFIVGKNEHLVQRDFNKYQKVITAMKLDSNFNFFAKSAGIYFFTQPQLKKQMKLAKFMSVWQESIVLVDEYDWILFDGSSENIVNQLNFYKQAKSIIGFSGSHLSQSEENCLNLAFHSTPVVFPTLDKLQGDKKTQLADLLISSNQGDYLQKIKEIIKDQVAISPVLIVASTNYSAIEKGFLNTNFDFKSFSHSQAAAIESAIEGRYLLRNASKSYGVYLLNESQGRGTDIQTNDEIDQNGGSYLIIADVFSKRSEEQIIGRIGRLNTKGRWQRVLYRYASKDSEEQLIIQEQREIELNLDRKHNQVQSILQNRLEAMENFLQQNQVPHEKISPEVSSKEDLNWLNCFVYITTIAILQTHNYIQILTNLDEKGKLIYLFYQFVQIKNSIQQLFLQSYNPIYF